MRNDMVDAFAFATMKICPSWNWPTHQTRKYTKRYVAHPLIIWLAKFLPIDAWIDCEWADDKDPIYMRENNTMFMGYRTYERLKEQTNEPRD